MAGGQRRLAADSGRPSSASSGGSGASWEVEGGEDLGEVEGGGGGDDDFDFHSQMDENGIIGLDDFTEELLEGRRGPLSDTGTPDPEEGPRPALASPGFELEEDLFEDLSYNLSELQDSEPLLLSQSPGQEAGLSPSLSPSLSLDGPHRLGESAGSFGAEQLGEEEEEEEGEPWLVHRPQQWRPDRDAQLDMTEDEREGEGSAGEDSQRGGGASKYWEEPVTRGPEDFGDISDIPMARFLTGFGEKDEEGEPATAYRVTKHNSVGVSGDSETGPEQDEEGQTPFSGTLLSRAQPLLLPAPRTLHQQNRQIGPSTTHLDRSFLCRLSREDLDAPGPDLQAEPFPDSPSSESSSADEFGGNSSPSLLHHRLSWDSGRQAREGEEEAGEDWQGELEDEVGDEAPFRTAWTMSVPPPSAPRQPPSPSASPPKHGPPKRHPLPPSPSASQSKTRISGSPLRATQTGDTRGRRIPRGVSPKVTPGGSSTPVTDTPRYGRGQLNYPLPDFSKVEPRVRFPKDGYRPPRGRGSPRCSTGLPVPPLVFKSPAEIVREVLLSSTEAAPRPAPSAGRRPPTPNATLPEEFKSPQQATALVHQLQEDYNRLLTKYAEAENTIDRLRLGAKVNLYADPPQPSHAVHTGTFHEGSKVMTLSFPQAQKAQIGPSADSAPQARHGTELSPDVPPAAAAASTPSPSMGPQVGERLTKALARQAERFRLQIESFEDLLRSGRLKPTEQMKGLSSLQQTQEALERGYLQAREEQRHLVQQGGDVGHFDPDREVEGQIFQLGMRLEDLKEQVDQVVRYPLTSGPPVAPPSSPPAPDPLTGPLSTSAPTPHPESPVSPVGGRDVGVSLEVSSVSGESDGEEGAETLPSALPPPLRHKHQRVEGEYSNLLDHYQSFRELPGLLNLHQGEGLTESGHGVSRTAGIPGEGSRRRERGEERRRKTEGEEESTAALEHPMETQDGLMDPLHGSLRNQSKSLLQEPHPHSSSSSGQQGPGSVGVASIDGGDFRGGGHKSRSSSLTSVEENGATETEHPPPSAARRNKTALPQDRIVSPETDSGFVGSESSRLTPAVCSPQHQRVRVRHPFYPGNRDEKLTPPPAATQRPTPSTRRSTPKEADGIPGVSRSEVNAGRNGPVLPSPSPATSPQHWGSSINSEFEPESCATHSESEGEGHSVLSAFARPANKQHYQQHSPSPSAAHPNGNLRRAQSSGLLLPNRHEAIQALHEEVSRLRQRLEGSLRRSSGNTPAPSMAPPVARGEPLPRPRRSSTPVLRSQEEGGRKEDEDGGEEVVQEDREPLRPTPRRRSASVPRLRSTLDITSDSDRVQSLPRPQSSRPVPASFAAQRSRKRAGEHIQEAVTFRGPYTGRQYSVLVPGDSEDPEPRERERDGRSERERASSACPHCCPAHHHALRGTATQVPPHGHTPPRHCPLCRGSGVHRERQAEPGVWTDQDSGSTPRGRQPMASPRKAKRGVFVTAPPPPTLGSVPVIQCVPMCPQPVLYYSTPLSNAPSSYAEPRLYLSVGGVSGVRGQRARGARQVRSLSLEEGVAADTLSRSLSRAIEAACSMREASRRMATSLSTGLHQQGALRQSCHY